MAIEYKSLKECGTYLKNGGLVAFPTETVYGLGANALNDEAVSNIFKIKERPKTDPLIVHIYSLDQLDDLVDLSEKEFLEVKKLADKFWPGPITLLLKASKNIPSIVTADTEYVGIRMPNNKIALELIKISNVPLAAPSANKFEHISPTKSEHVENDFKNNHSLAIPLYILLNEDNSFNVGIESTILKMNFESSVFSILRPGFITFEEINDIFQDSSYHIISDIDYKSSGEKMDSSGQSIRHYATSSHTILLTPSRKINLEDLPIRDDIGIIDIGDSCKSISQKVKYYDNLSTISNIDEMMNNFYSKLREFEIFSNKNNINALYIVNNKQDENIRNNLSKYNSLYDRMFRSSSGNCLVIN